MTFDCAWKYRTLACLDGDLAPDQQAHVQRHIGSCAACASLAHDLKRDIALARRATSPAAAPLFDPEMLAAAKRRTARRRLRRLAAATAVVLLALGASSLRAHEQQERTYEATRLAADIAELNVQLDLLDEAIDLWRNQPVARPAADDMRWLERAETNAVLTRAAELFQSELGIEYARANTEPTPHVN